MFPRDAAYSLFGGPLVLDVGPSINGEIIRVRVQPINTISVTALGISLLLFASFMCFYLYPLYRSRRTASERARRVNDAEQLGEEEKKTLLSWLHFRSRDRFSTYDRSRSPSPNPSFKVASLAPSLRRQQSSSPSSFARGSLIPHLSPTTTATLSPPPPAYASRPSSPLSLSEFRFPSSPLSAPHPRLGRDGRTNPQTSSVAPPPAARTRSGSSSPPATPPLMVRMGPFMAAQRSVSASTLHPPAGANMHVPSRARVYSDSEPRSAASAEHDAVRHAARNRQNQSTGLGITGVSLAARGRQLTRGPSAVWNAGVGHGRGGSAF